MNGNLIPQVGTVLALELYSILKGYCNATAMCKANNKKKWADYKRLKSTKEYWEALSRSMGIPIDQLVIENESYGSNEERGTWVHLDIAMDLAQWISVDFRVWANKTLSATINNEFKAETENAKQIKANLEIEYAYIWEKARQVGKVARRGLTDSIKDYLLRHPELPESQVTWMYSNVSDGLRATLYEAWLSQK